MCYRPRQITKVGDDFCCLDCSNPNLVPKRHHYSFGTLIKPLHITHETSINKYCSVAESVQYEHRLFYLLGTDLWQKMRNWMNPIPQLLFILPSLFAGVVHYIQLFYQVKSEQCSVLFLSLYYRTMIWY